MLRVQSEEEVERQHLVDTPKIGINFCMAARRVEHYSSCLQFRTNIAVLVVAFGVNSESHGTNLSAELSMTELTRSSAFTPILGLQQAPYHALCSVY